MAETEGAALLQALGTGAGLGGVAGSVVFLLAGADGTTGAAIGAVLGLVAGIVSSIAWKMSGGTGEPASTTIRTGDRFHGWIVGRERSPGPGSISRVFDARRGHLMGLLKVAPRDSLGPDEIARLRKEADAARNLDGFAAAAIDAMVTNRFCAIVYENRGSTDLQEWTARRHRLGHRLPDAEVFNIAYGLAEGLRRLHGEEIVHRDLKPSNVVIKAGLPVIVDYGQSWFSGASLLTRQSRVLGTLAYNSPEQASGGSLRRPSTDIFSYASTLYFAATGRPPFGTEPDDLAALIQAARVDLSPLPEWLQGMLRPCFAKAADERPSAAELCDALRLVASANGFDLPLPPSPEVARRHALGWTRWGRVTAGAVAAAALLLVAAAGWSRPAPTSAQSAPRGPQPTPDPTVGSADSPTTSSEIAPTATTTAVPTPTTTTPTTTVPTTVALIDRLRDANWPTSGLDGSTALMTYIGAGLAIPDWVSCETVEPEAYCVAGFGGEIQFYSQNPLQEFPRMAVADLPTPYEYLSQVGFTDESIAQLLRVD